MPWDNHLQDSCLNGFVRFIFLSPFQNGMGEVTVKSSRHRKIAVLQSIQYSVDFVTATLLLTGQITTSGIFVVPEVCYLASTGEILGGVWLKGQTSGAVGILRLVDIIATLLLVVNAVRE